MTDDNINEPTNVPVKTVITGTISGYKKGSDTDNIDVANISVVQLYEALKELDIVELREILTNLQNSISRHIGDYHNPHRVSLSTLDSDVITTIMKLLLYGTPNNNTNPVYSLRPNQFYNILSSDILKKIFPLTISSSISSSQIYTLYNKEFRRNTGMLLTDISGVEYIASVPSTVHSSFLKTNALFTTSSPDKNTVFNINEVDLGKSDIFVFDDSLKLTETKFSVLKTNAGTVLSSDITFTTQTADNVGFSTIVDARNINNNDLCLILVDTSTDTTLASVALYDTESLTDSMLYMKVDNGGDITSFGYSTTSIVDDTFNVFFYIKNSTVKTHNLSLYFSKHPSIKDNDWYITNDTSNYTINVTLNETVSLVLTQITNSPIPTAYCDVDDNTDISYSTTFSVPSDIVSANNSSLTTTTIRSVSYPTIDDPSESVVLTKKYMDNTDGDVFEAYVVLKYDNGQPQLYKKILFESDGSQTVIKEFITNDICTSLTYMYSTTVSGYVCISNEMNSVASFNKTVPMNNIPNNVVISQSTNGVCIHSLELYKDSFGDARPVLNFLNNYFTTPTNPL